MTDSESPVDCMACIAAALTPIINPFGERVCLKQMQEPYGHISDPEHGGT